MYTNKFVIFHIGYLSSKSWQSFEYSLAWIILFNKYLLLSMQGVSFSQIEFDPVILCSHKSKWDPLLTQIMLRIFFWLEIWDLRLMFLFADDDDASSSDGPARYTCAHTIDFEKLDFLNLSHIYIHNIV